MAQGGANSLFNAPTALPDNHAVPTTTEVGAIVEIINGIGNLEKAKSVTSTFNSSSVGILASGMVAQLDDTATTAITEDQFGVVRMSSRRAMLVEGVASGTNQPVTESHLPTSAAAADALANPTITQIGVDNMLFNGTSWDRQRGMSVDTTTGDTGAKTATGTGATQTNVGNMGMQLFIVLGAVSGTTPTATFKLQGSVDGGTNFYDIPGAATASLTISTKVGMLVYPGVVATAASATTGTILTLSSAIPRTWRVVWTIGGTTPSFTITSITYNYLPN